MSKTKIMIDVRIEDEVTHILQTEQTVREIAKVFGVSKSTVHKDLTERLEHRNPNKAKKVRTVLDYHKSVRHMRGGVSTKKKWAAEKTA